MGYLVAAYLILWLGIFGYLFWMGGALRGLRAELGELRAALVARAPEVPEEQEPVAAPPVTPPPVELRGR